MRIAVLVVTWILVGGWTLQAQSVADLLFKGHGDSISVKDRGAIAEGRPYSPMSATDDVIDVEWRRE